MWRVPWNHTTGKHRGVLLRLVRLLPLLLLGLRLGLGLRVLVLQVTSLLGPQASKQASEEVRKRGRRRF